MSSSTRTILVITDREDLGRSVRRAIEADQGPAAAVFALTWTEAATVLTPTRLDEADFFVLELFRSYAGGMRAEGVVLAERLRGRKPTLVFSPLSLAEDLASPEYWDTASSDSIGQRVASLIVSPHACAKSFENVVKHFEEFLRIPPQH